MKPPAAKETNADLKRQVHGFWNEQSCDTQAAQAVKHSRDYFEQIESFRYYDQPFIHSFAQFTRYRGRRVLEVGFGAGTDFTQWLRAGAVVSGIDLTEEAAENLRQRTARYGLPPPEQLHTGDAEHLPFEDGSFDLGYSFGVLHHTPDTGRAIAELVRVVRPGGEIKIMLYNRHSIFVLNRWVRFALLKGKPWRGLRWVLWHHNESLGTKGYTRTELARMLAKLPLEQIQVETVVTSGDWLSASAFKPLNLCYRAALAMAGNRHPWRAEQFTDRINDRDARPGRTAAAQPAAGPGMQCFGNPLGFYHCITARKVGVSP